MRLLPSYLRGTVAVHGFIGAHGFAVWWFDEALRDISPPFVTIVELRLIAIGRIGHGELTDAQAKGHRVMHSKEKCPQLAVTLSERGVCHICLKVEKKRDDNSATSRSNK